MDQLPEALPPVHKPRNAALAAAVKRSTKVALRTWGNSDDQLPLYSPLPPSTAARQMPFHPVSCLSADQLPRITVAPPASLKVQPPLADRWLELGATFQVPLNVRPSALRALHVDVLSFSLNASLVSVLATTSTARTQPMSPRLVRTIYQISLPTASTIGKSVSPSSRVAMRSVSASC